ncbi:M23 family metallopeptidase [Marinifilum fragile]|uniref:M23 family metallopeptidase n=1 Tax=Marinifilum fragile TaxID=570161 RepID=UPI002AA931E1|nr:M23 family metallopeptidase [Marinifilum fragile]
MIQLMKRVILFLALFASALSVVAQKTKSFEEYKKQEQAKFRKYVDEERKRFEAFKKNELDWNKEILGYEVETPVSDRVDTKHKDFVIKPAPPKYVNLSANLDDEIIQLKRKIDEKNTVEGLNNKSLNDHKSSLIEVEKRSIPSTKPILTKYRLSSKFGNRFHPTLYRWRFHGGVDMACPKGTDIHIPADGVIVKSGWNGGYGNYIKVKHGNGYETIYGHLSKVSVKKGQKVNKGDVIGKVGSTGRSTGPHLHYEIIKNKKRVNPERFFG